MAGHYTLSQCAVQLDVVPSDVAKRLRKYPIVPTTLLGRLAIGTVFRGEGHGAILLMDALYRSLRSSKEVGSAAVVVDAIDSAATALYSKYGFLRLPKIERRLFLPMDTIEQLFK